MRLISWTLWCGSEQSSFSQMITPVIKYMWPEYNNHVIIHPDDDSEFNNNIIIQRDSSINIITQQRQVCYQLDK